MAAGSESMSFVINCVVVTSDTDLTSVPGLAVENWAVVS